jgi:hypothetical protein
VNHREQTRSERYADGGQLPFSSRVIRKKHCTRINNGGNGFLEGHPVLCQVSLRLGRTPFEFAIYDRLTDGQYVLRHILDQTAENQPGCRSSVRQHGSAAIRGSMPAVE